MVKNRTNRIKSSNGDGPPHVIIHEKKEVVFLIESGMAYMGIGTFLKNLGVSDYKGLVCKNKSQFNELKEQYG